jgi:hypothetical protein
MVFFWVEMETCLAARLSLHRTFRRPSRKMPMLAVRGLDQLTREERDILKRGCLINYNRKNSVTGCKYIQSIL